MKVTEVARRTGVGAHAVRFYVRAGLLRAERDPSNNYKQFGETHVLRLRFIKGAQSLGFSLAEIRALLARMDQGECTCDTMHLRLADKILDLRRQIEGLLEQLGYMQRVYEDWHGRNDGPHDLGRLCQFLEREQAPPSGAGATVASAPDEPAAGTGMPRRTSKGATRAARRQRRSTTGSDSMFRAGPIPDGRRHAAGRPEVTLAVLELLNRDWRSAC